MHPLLISVEKSVLHINFSCVFCLPFLLANVHQVVQYVHADTPVLEDFVPLYMTKHRGYRRRCIWPHSWLSPGRMSVLASTIYSIVFLAYF